MSMVPLKFNATDTMVIVFQLPDVLPGDHLFSGGTPVAFKVVDWFDAAPSIVTGRAYTEDELRDFVRQKRYYHPSRDYLLLRRDGRALLLDPPAEVAP